MPPGRENTIGRGDLICGEEISFVFGFKSSGSLVLLDVFMAYRSAVGFRPSESRRTPRIARMGFICLISEANGSFIRLFLMRGKSNMFKAPFDPSLASTKVYLTSDR